MSDTGILRGTLLVEDGSVGVPSLAAYSKRNSGLYFDSNGLNVSIAGVKLLGFTATGISGALTFANDLTLSASLKAANLKAGITQVAAAAAAGEIWVDTSADNVLKLGV
jgi:hypothetical protein